MAYQYDIEEMSALLKEEIKSILDQQSLDWLKQQHQRYKADSKTALFNFTFTAIPRFVNKGVLQTDEEIEAKFREVRSGLHISGWTTDRLVRSWWLLQLPVNDKDQYIYQVEMLFKAAEMNEQVALYGAIPLLAFPQSFSRRAAEGIRTNIGIVFDAVVLNNPYPSEYLEEAAWNQLVLKAFFMDKPVNQIIGLDERANQKLAYILSDYAHERWAAGRPVNPLLWRPVSRFIDEKIFPDIQKLFQADNEKEKQAAALACYQSTYAPAKNELEQHDALKLSIENGELNWNDFD